jgi:carboxylate-amine ligase
MTAYTFGIEEEFFVVDGTTGELARALPAQFLPRCRDRLGGRVGLELLQSQIETQTVPHDHPDDALAELKALRAGLIDAAGGFDLTVLAAGTHPVAEWRQQRFTERARYRMVMSDLGMLGYRNLLCGLHVHVAMPDPSRRVALMTRTLPYLPYFLALSSSSPFWGGRSTGLLAYRPAAYDELPRTGLPPAFADEADYADYLAQLTGAGIIPDASYIWWAVRPSLAHPTLELRIADACTRVEDGVAIASLFRALVHRLDVDPGFGPSVDTVVRAIAEENRWRVQRDGLDARIVDPAGRGGVMAREAIAELVADLGDDAVMLGDDGMPDAVARILDFGTSAQRQLDIHATAREAGLERDEALDRVVRWLMQETAGEVATLPPDTAALLPALGRGV